MPGSSGLEMREGELQPSSLTTANATSGPNSTTSSSPTPTNVVKGSPTRNKIAVGTSVGGVALLILIAAGVFLWLRRKKYGHAYIEEWHPHDDDPEGGGEGQTNARGATQSGTETQQTSAANSVMASQMHVRIPDVPPTVQLPAGWPYRSQGGEKARMAREKPPSIFPELRLTRLLDSTPFEDLENGGELISPALADAGSTNLATPISRREVRREPSVRSLTSLWSWSHRATRSVADSEMETLPAYTFRRSGSTTRSRTRSLRSSVHRGQGGAEDRNPPDYPFELARKIAQFYQRPPKRVEEPLPPPDYGQGLTIEH